MCVTSYANWPPVILWLEWPKSIIQVISSPCITQERHLTQNFEKKVTNMSGLSALLRSNGEPVFKNPWEGRAFGVVVTLTHAGRYQWREFNNVFIEHISRAEQTGNSSTYYQRSLAALEQLALQKGFVSADELQELPTLLAADDNHH